jgi:hypothetical protein
VDKFDRNYELLIQKRDGQTLKIERPFTVEFDIHRNSLSSANVCQIRIYNLAPDTRNQIRKDQFDYGDQRLISFRAGYGKKLSLAFSGNITQAWSVREGVNMITQIECFDGGFAYVNAITDQQYPSGTPQASIIDSLATSLGQTGVQIGAIGTYEGQISRGNSYSGNTMNILGEITGGGAFIDNRTIHCLNDDEALAGEIQVINAASGLLGTPILEQQYINLDMLFEPSLKVAQLVKIESATEERFNGTHKVLSIKHRGIISEVVSGSAITSLGLLPGAFFQVGTAESV